MEKYQQGDVLFVKVEENVWIIKNDDNKKMMVPKENSSNSYRYKREVESVNGNENNVLTVAHGEATGHSHAFYMTDHTPGIAITAFGSITTRVGKVPEYINITGGSATIKHEEHNALKIPAGHYKVNIVQEWDHISRSARYVVD